MRQSAMNSNRKSLCCGEGEGFESGICILCWLCRRGIGAKMIRYNAVHYRMSLSAVMKASMASCFPMLTLIQFGNLKPVMLRIITPLPMSFL